MISEQLKRGPACPLQCECKFKLKQSSVIVNGGQAVQLGKGGATLATQIHRWKIATQGWVSYGVGSNGAIGGVEVAGRY